MDKSTVRKIQGLVLFVAMVAVICFKTDAVLNVVGYIFGICYPFLLGGAMAFVINILMRFLERTLFGNKWMKDNKIVIKIKRPVSLLLSMITILLAIAGVSLMVIPQLVDAVVQMASHLQGTFQDFYVWLEDVFAKQDWSESLLTPLETVSQINWSAVVEKGFAFLSGGIGSILGSTFSVATVVIGKVFNWMIATVFACYLLTGKEKIMSQGRSVLKAYLPEKWYEKVTFVLSLTGKTFASFITGQCLEAVILGCMFLVTMTLGGFPYALVISVLIGFTAIIPYVGAFLGWFVGVLMILTVSPLKALFFVILFFVLQQIEENLIYPRVVGKSVGLPAIWVLVAITLGGSLLGVVGMLVFIPLVSVCYALLRMDVQNRLAKKEK